MNHSIPEVIFEEMPGKNGNLGLITLDRQNALNALNHAMFLALDKQLTDWTENSSIKAVVIRAAEGRAFCAGGDIRHAYERGLAKDPILGEFFGDEYRLNARIFHFPKPYIALLDGITMGGGAGISINGSHRVGTERLVFAMPETGIGFFPDVGASYFLSRLPKKMGFYLGLSGAKISYQDCFALGLVEQIIARDSQAKLIEMLADTVSMKKEDVSAVIKSFAAPVAPSTLMDHANEIETCFSGHTVADILQALENQGSEWCQQTADIIKTKSPTSLKVTLKELQLGEKLNFDACMKMEYKMTRQFIVGHDFFEGVRAAIIDKDQKPHWNPVKLDDVSEQDVASYF